MDYLGQLPVRTNLHLVITPEECNALVNALAFFSDYYSPTAAPDLEHWQLVARDEHLPRYDQLRSKLARLT